MIDGQITITGLVELNDMLQQLPAKIEANILRGALRAGQKVIKDEAKLRCPVGIPSTENAKLYGAYPGALRDSIRISTRFQNGVVMVSVKAGNKVAYYAHMVEYGTRPHDIFPVSAKSLFFAGLNKEFIHHPGAIAANKGRGFMRLALDTRAEAALQAAADYMTERIPKELAK